MSLQEFTSSGPFGPQARPDQERSSPDSPFQETLDEPAAQEQAEQADLTSASGVYDAVPDDAATGPDLRAARRRAWSVIGLAIVVPAAVAALVAWQLFGGSDDPAPTITRVATTPTAAVAEQVSVADAAPVATATASAASAAVAQPTESPAASTTASVATTETTETTSEVAAPTTSSLVETTAAANVSTEQAVDLSALDPAARLAAWTDVQMIEVLPGETLWLMAQNYDTTVSAIATLNDVSDPTSLSVGQVLRVPVGFAEEIEPPADVVSASTETTEAESGGASVQAVTAAAPSAPDALRSWHTMASLVIEPGDSLASIAEANNTTVEALMALNGIAEPDKIFAGVALLVPVGYQGALDSTAFVADAAADSSVAATTDDMLEEETAVNNGDMLEE